MGHWSNTSSLLNYIWDFILVWTLGAYFLCKQLCERHRVPTGIHKRDGQVAIITGGSRGIGLEIVRQLLSHNIHTIIASSSSNCGNLLEKLRNEFPGAKVEYHKVDMSSSKAVRNFAENFLNRQLPLHLLINNAGIMFGPYKITDDGIESQFSTNYIGHFLLTYLLLPKLTETGKHTLKSRIINVSSCCHYAGYMKIHDLNSKMYYSAHGTYAQSKLAQVMHAILLQEFLNKNKVPVTINAVHPGIVDTKLYQHTLFDMVPFICKFIFKTAKQGADGVVHVALSWETESVGGKYFENCHISEPNKLAAIRELQIGLWKKTCELLDLNDFDPPV